MKVLGIIAEYNPFHNGHKYHIEESKKITGCDYVVAVMSGNFTQQGNIAIYDKFTRAKLAIENGVDLVIELPTIFANSSAEYFSRESIKLLNSLNIVDAISFGAECNNIEILQYISNVIIQNEYDISKKIKETLKNGNISAAKAREEVLKELFKNDTSLVAEISKSNNILAIEYLKALKKLRSNIKPYLIKRMIANHSEITLQKGTFSSATSIRKSIKGKKIEVLKNQVPSNTYEVICKKNPTFSDMLFNILRYKITSMPLQNLKEIFEIGEGLENKIKKEITTSKSYDEFISKIKSKRYVESKIRRILVNILLDITGVDFLALSKLIPTYVHVLAVSENGKKILSRISKNTNLTIITSLNDRIIKSSNEYTRYQINKDILASNIHSIVNNDTMLKDYYNKL